MNELKQLTIDGKPLLDFGVITDGSETFNGAEPDVTTISVPGRSGDLVLYNGRYKNLPIAYSCLMRADFRHRVDELRAFLTYKVGYRRIEDAREEEYYRMGRLVGGFKVSDIVWTADAGLFKLTFSEKPFRYLKRGELPQTLHSSDEIENPTLFEALPILRVHGTGTMQIGGVPVTVRAHAQPYIDIDCEGQNAWYGSENCNRYVEVDSDTFPALQPGKTAVVLPATMSQIDVTPRWRTI